MWATGRKSPSDTGMGGMQSHGVHPFLLVQTNSDPNEFFGIFFRNMNA